MGEGTSSESDPAPAGTPARSRRAKWLRRLAVLLIVVVPPGSVALGWWLWTAEHALSTTLEGCGWVRERGARMQCYSKALDRLIARHGFEKARPIIIGYTQELDSLGEQCHLAMHPIGTKDGRQAARKGTDPPPFREVDWCTEGYVHGFMIGYLQDAKDLEQARATAAKLCVSVVRGACIHAFGHFFAKRSDTVGEAVEQCYDVGPLSIEPDIDHKGDCLYGLFMERSIMDRRAKSKRFVNCSEEWHDLAQEYCWRYMPARVATLGGDADDALRTCRTAPKRYRKPCEESYRNGRITEDRQALVHPGQLQGGSTATTTTTMAT